VSSKKINNEFNACQTVEGHSKTVKMNRNKQRRMKNLSTCEGRSKKVKEGSAERRKEKLYYIGCNYLATQ
jgi:hypothetical protein